MATRKAKTKARPKAKSQPAEATLQPHKIVGQLIGKRLNESGEIVGEEMMGEVAIYAPQFGEVKRLVDDATQAAKQAQSQN